MHKLTETKIFSGTANPLLAQAIADNLELPLGNIEVDHFSDGEIRVEINEHVRGHDVIIVQPTCAPANNNLMELLIMTETFRRSACKSVTAVVPYWGYARQDRRPPLTRTPITSSLVARMCELAGINKVVIVDIHSDQQQGFFQIPVINISAAPLMVADIWKKQYPHLTIVSPDTGGVVRARSIAKRLDDADLAIIDKRRPKANVSEVMNLIGNVMDRYCIIVDDMIDTAGTLCKAAIALKNAGAAYVAAYASHPVLSGSALDNIASTQALDEVVVTDTIPMKDNPPEKIRVLSVANLIGESTRRLLSNQSVSEIYT